MSTIAQEEADRYFSQKEHYTSHPEDRDNHSLHSSDGPEHEVSKETYPQSDDGDDEETLHSMATAATAAYQIPTTLFDANTGPKGVIADAQSFDRAKKRSFRKTLATFTNSLTISGQSHSSRQKSSRESSDSELGASGDDEFMRQWRQNRLQELSNGRAPPQRRLSPSRRYWGHLDAVNADGYLDAVEKVANDVVVVVCIYDPEVSLPPPVLSYHCSWLGDTCPGFGLPPVPTWWPLYVKLLEDGSHLSLLRKSPSHTSTDPLLNSLMPVPRLKIASRP